MEQFTIWYGVRCGNDEPVELFEFEGEKIGEVKEGTDSREKQTVVYRAADGRIVIHEIRSRPQDEETHARVFFFSSLDEARRSFGWVLEAAGLHPARGAMLRTFEGWD